MEEQTNWAPFVVKPHRINNYTHLIALLRHKQTKYKDCRPGPAIASFSKALGSAQETLNLDSVLEGFLHEKLKEKGRDFEQELFTDFNRAIKLKIKDLKIENDQKVYANKIGNLKDIESLLLSKPTQSTFKDDMLFDMYSFISQKSEPLKFLQDSYLKYITKFYIQNVPADTAAAKGASLMDDITLKRVVSEFVKLRFNGEEYKIRIYESRYLWAEAFVFLRIGRIDLMNELLGDFNTFFEFTYGLGFKNVFNDFQGGRKPNFVVELKNDDKFKMFLFDLVNEKAKSDGLVINTAEDYIWLRLIMKKDFKNDIDVFESYKIKFMIALFTRKYTKAIDILLRSDFGVVPKFFLLRELCLEQNLYQGAEEGQSTNIFESSNTVPKTTLRSRKLLDDSSSTMSLASITESSSSISPVFLSFLFNIVTRMSTKEHKVKMIEMLKNHPDYYDVVPDYIVKFELFDILGNPSERSAAVDFSLDYKISSKVLHRLREMGNKSKIVHLYDIIDEATMINVLKETLEDSILVDGSVDQDIVEKYIKSGATKDIEELNRMYGLYRFFKNPTVANLRQTVLFDQCVNLKPYKFVVEKLFSKIVEVVKAENDKLMAKHIFKLCGTLNLNEECLSKVTKDLVLLI